MQINQDGETLLMELCRRIERICRCGSLTDDEIQTTTAMEDRQTVSLLYQHFRQQGKTQEVADQESRVYAIRLLLNVVFS